MTEKFGKPIKHQVFISASRERVYDTISSGDGWNAFFTHSTEVDPKPNGKIVFRWKDWGPNFYNVEAEGKVVKAERPGLFSFQWYPIGKETPTTVEFLLMKKYGGTVIELTEDGYTDSETARAMILECASGWGEALTLLKFYLEFGVIYTPPKK
jgi:uncharacterized protein YndB with AHSA1/START domain